jgi:hypothetical protein
MFKKDSAKVNNQQQETFKVPSYGNMKIDEAKGKHPTLKCRLLGANKASNQSHYHPDQNRHG